MNDDYRRPLDVGRRCLACKCGGGVMFDLDRMEKAINSKRISPPNGMTREGIRLFIIRSAAESNEGISDRYDDGADSEDLAEV